MADSNDSRPGPCEQALISKAASRAVEFLEFLSGSEGLAVVKSGRRVTITYTPPEDPGGGDPGEIGIEDVDGLSAALADKAATSHTHATSEVTGLDSALAGKASTSHSHATSDVTGLDSAISALYGDIGTVASAVAGKADATHSHATSDVTGLDSALAGKAASSHTHATSEVTGLDSALAGKAASSHTHATSEVTGLDSALAGKAASSHTHATSEVTGLDSALAGKAASSHSHATSDVTGLDSALSGKAATSHTHATSEVTGLDSALASKAATSHTHATSEVTGLDSALAGKAASSHTHATSEVTGLDSALSGKAASSHSHATSDVTGLDSALSGKAATSHNHNASDINAGTLDAARLPVAGTTTIGGVKRNAGSAGQYVTGFDTDGSTMYDEPTSGYRPGRNHIINGNFAVAQRAVETNIPDDSYFIDRWYALSDGNIMEAQRQSVHSEGRDQVLAVSTSGGGAEASKKYGIAQIIEAANCIDLVGKTVTLSFDARLYGGSNPVELKAAVIAWSGTADTVTSDIISSWNAVTTTPTLIANATFENTPAAVSLSGSWQNFSLTCDVDTSGTENLIVFIWADNPPSSGPEYFYITNVQLEAGSAATPFEHPILSDQLARCQRYYEVVRYNSAGQGLVPNLYFGTQYLHTWYYRATKFKTPSVSLVTGSWTGGTPTITPSADTCYFVRAAGVFIATGTSGNIALAADAEL